MIKTLVTCPHWCVHPRRHPATPTPTPNRMSLLDADLADPLLPYLDAKTMATLARAHSTCRGWARAHNRHVHLDLGYLGGGEFPAHGEDANGASLWAQYRMLNVFPKMHSTYLMAKPGEPTAIRTERDIPFGSALSRRDSVMTAALVHDNAERSPVPLVVTLLQHSRGADIVRAFTDYRPMKGDRTMMERPNRVRGQSLRCINRLSSHFSPRAKFRVRVTLSVAHRPDGEAGDHDEEIVERQNGLMLPKKHKPSVAYTHYNAYTPAFYVVSRLKPGEVAARVARARRRALAASTA